MPKHCQKITLEEVQKFFAEEIDGMGQHDGYPRNQETPRVLELCRDWQLCDLTEEEFRNLLIPDGTDTLIKDKDLSTTEGNSKTTILKWKRKIESGEEVPPIIVRTKLEREKMELSFYIEDGAHRAIAYKTYFECNSYKPVKAYIGTRSA